MPTHSSLPSYIENSPSINTLLHKLNITSKKETDMFHRLCSLKSSVITYRDAIKITDNQDDEFIFNNFIQKLQNLQVAVLCGDMKSRDTTPHHIRLCEEGSITFFNEFITQLILQAYQKADTPIPTKSTLKQVGHEIPNNYYISIDQNLLLQAYQQHANADEDDNPIYALKLESKDIFLFTYQSVAILADMCIKHLQQAFRSSNILSQIASTMNENTSVLEERINSSDILVWDEIVTAISKHKSNFNQSIYSEYMDVMDLVSILHTIIKPKIMQIKNQEKSLNVIDTFISNILTTMKKYNDGLNKKAFDSLLLKESESLQLSEEDTKLATEKLNKEYIATSTSPQDTQTMHNKDIIININNIYIHSVMAVNIISDRFYGLSTKLQQYYYNQMRKYLIKQLPPSEIVFFSEDDLEVSVHQKVNEYDELYATILKMPILLANILTKRTSPNPHSPNDTSSQKFNDLQRSKKLALFFNMRTKELLPWYAIFNISLAPLAEDVHAHLSFLRKFFIFFTGRFKALNNKLVRIQKTSNIIGGVTEEGTQLNKRLLESSKSIKPNS